MTKCVTSPQLIDILCFSTRFHAYNITVYYISKLYYGPAICMRFRFGLAKSVLQDMLRGLRFNIKH